MTTEIRVPQLGESVVEATIARWLKHEGEAVAEGDAVAELETEKVNVEVPAEGSGVLERVLHAEGETVNVGDVIGVLSAAATPDGNQATGAHSRAGAAVPPPPSAPTAGVAAQETPAPAASAPSPAAAAAAAEAEGQDTPHPITPVAQRLATEHGIDAAQVRGSGPGGRVTKEDVLDLIQERPEAAATGPVQTNAGQVAGRGSAAPAPTPVPAPGPSQAPRPSPATAINVHGGAAAAVAWSAAQTPPAAPPLPAPNLGPAQSSAGDARGEERVRLSRRRLTIARRLLEAQHAAAMLTTFNEVDMSAVMEVRRRRRDAFRERHGVGLGFMSFFAKAAIGALKAFPDVNAELNGDDLIVKRYYDVGIAVSTDEGLVVPVVRDADRLSFAAVERQIADLATRARERKLTLEDLRGGTFTITNGGVFGSLLSTPILNPPQVAILGMHKIEERPVALSGQVVIRPMMYLALTYDHRVVDGKEAVSFLVRVKELIEDPEALLLEG